MNNPIIGITTTLADAGAAQLARAYWQSVRNAGGVPLLIPPTDDTTEQEAILEQLDGLLLSGGADLNPILVGEDPVPELHGICPERDEFELRLCRRAHDRQIPILGICRGAQIMAVALGGSICQDIGRWMAADGRALTIKHSQDAPRDCATHRVSCLRQGCVSTLEASDAPFVSPFLSEAFGPTFAVNSFHHQAVTDAGPHMEVTAKSSDGVIEAMQQRTGESFLLAVQWHPECMPTMAPIFSTFVDAAYSYGRTLEVHNRIQTLDSHCDTPMFFDQLLRDYAEAHNLSVDNLDPLDEMEALCLQNRNNTVLVDAEKMDDGHLDETFMAAYIPQGPRTPEGYAAARRLVEETYRRLDVMIAATDDFAAARPASSSARPVPAAGSASSSFLSAASSADLFDEALPLSEELPPVPEASASGLDEAPLLIHRAIENGYAIGRDLSLLQHYKDLGCEYMTLCHNGHNDICDSARPLLAGTRANGTYPEADEPQEEHGGLSEFGCEVVHEMNRIGLLIDLSHAAESTFYDVLTLSTKPVAVTHACCRAICDHPRNLTDDQLRAIAAKGGVVQCTMYPGFLSLYDPEAASATQHGDYGAAPVFDGCAVESPEPPTLLTFIRHLEHMIEVCGIDHVGIGSDFDGDGGVPGLDHAGCMLNITRILLERGYTEDDLCKIWGDNFRRVLAAQS